MVTLFLIINERFLSKGPTRAECLHTHHCSQLPLHCFGIIIINQIGLCPIYVASFRFHDGSFRNF